MSAQPTASNGDSDRVAEQQSVYNAGIGNYTRSEGRNTFGTLAELEADLRYVRELGAPDGATVIGTSRASIYVAEVQWIGDNAMTAPDPGDRVAETDRREPLLLGHFSEDDPSPRWMYQVRSILRGQPHVNGLSSNDATTPGLVEAGSQIIELVNAVIAEASDG